MAVVGSVILPATGAADPSRSHSRFADLSTRRARGDACLCWSSGASAWPRTAGDARTCETAGAESRKRIGDNRDKHHARVHARASASACRLLRPCVGRAASVRRRTIGARPTPASARSSSDAPTARIHATRYCGDGGVGQRTHCSYRVNSALSPRLGRLLLWTNTEHAGRGPIHYCNRSRKRACGEALRVFLPHVQASAGPLRPCNEAVLCPIAPRAIGHECGAPVLVVPNPHSCLGIEPFTGSWPASDDAALG
jgi:hypothetical protein